ncbi:MAG: PH domain-containing protein, partial [Verrucomicrobiota bacterium]
LVKGEKRCRRINEFLAEGDAAEYILDNRPADFREKRSRWSDGDQGKQSVAIEDLEEEEEEESEPEEEPTVEEVPVEMIPASTPDSLIPRVRQVNRPGHDTDEPGDEIADDDEYHWVEQEEGEELEDDDRYYDDEETGVDENEIILRRHPSIFSYPKTLLSLILAALIAACLWIFRFDAGEEGNQILPLLPPVIATVIAFGFVVYFILEYWFDEYVVTRKRVEALRGIIIRSSKEVQISDIRTINVQKRGLLGLLGVGTVNFASAGTSGVDVVFTDVRGAHQVKKVIRRVAAQPEAAREFLITGKKKRFGRLPFLG